MARPCEHQHHPHLRSPENAARGQSDVQGGLLIGLSSVGRYGSGAGPGADCQVQALAFRPLRQVMLIDCTSCHTHVDAEIGGQLEYWASINHPAGRFMLLRCLRCKSPLLIEQENSGNMAAGDIWDSVPTVLYPQPDLRV